LQDHLGVSAACRRSRSASTSAAGRVVVRPARSASDRRCNSRKNSPPVAVARPPGSAESGRDSWESAAKLRAKAAATKARSSGGKPSACCMISSRCGMIAGPRFLPLFSQVAASRSRGRF
jgi:hypothetical protein